METDIHRGHKAGIPQHNSHKFGAEAGFVPEPSIGISDFTIVSRCVANLGSYF